jgi:hypothetical protein
MPTFVILYSSGEALKVLPDCLAWAKDGSSANTYTSKYQAKRHLKELDNVPDDVRIVELVIE